MPYRSAELKFGVADPQEMCIVRMTDYPSMSRQAAVLALLLPSTISPSWRDLKSSVRTLRT